MFRNYFKVAFRNLIKHKLYSVINIAGLTIGLACCLLIYFFVRYEWSFDGFHEHAQRLYRVYITEDLPTRDPFSYVHAPALLAGALEASFPEVERAVRIDVRTDVIRVGSISYTEQYHVADSDFFEVLTFPLMQGDARSALEMPGSVVLTKRMALKLFGTPDVLDRQLQIKVGDDFRDFVVTGIAQDPPDNSSVRFDLVIPFDNVKTYISEAGLNAWFDVFCETYVLLSENHNPDDFETKLATVVKQNYPERTVDMVTLHLQPIEDIHLNPDIPAGFTPTSDPVYSYILMGIALLVLTIACINFMTLAIGRSSGRAREIGVRKVLGAYKKQLMRQFWGEAILMSFLSLLLAMVLTELCVPVFSDLAGRELSTSYDLQAILILAGLMLMVGSAAGSYPAIVLARLQPVLTVKGDSQLVRGGFFGRSLVVIQFSLSVLLIISSLIMADQLNYLRAKNLGFKKEQVVVVKNFAPIPQSNAVVERFRNAVAGHSDVRSVSGASTTFAMPWTTMGYNLDGDFRQFSQITVDHDYLSTMQIELVEGRDFSRQFGTDSSEAIIVNREFVKYFDWDSGVGRKLPGDTFPPHRIIGVVEDFNFDNLQNDIGPLVMVLDPSTLLQGVNDISTSVSPRALNYINVRIGPENIREMVKFLERSWSEAVPGQPFLFSFLDDDVNQQYQQDERWGNIVSYASTFAILIAGMGLFGLATLIVVRRTKEIGIRKVLGASIPNIIWMLSNDFGRLILIANIIAWPFAFYAMDRWLEDFAYRVDISLLNFVISSVIVIALAWLAVSYQSIKAALANPVRSLRYE